MHDRVGKLFQTLRQPFLRNGMSLTLMNKANESQLAAMSKPRVPRGNQMAAKTNKETNVSLPELRRLSNLRYKNCGNQHKQNESPAYNRKYGNK